MQHSSCRRGLSDQTLARPVALTSQHTMSHDQSLKYDVPSEWVYPFFYHSIKSYTKEATIIVFDHAGFVWCGSEMPTIDLRLDRHFTNNGQTCYNFPFVLPTPEETGQCGFDHLPLINLEKG